jgi:sugar-specific transcriptional regulator TrmB
MIVFFGDCEFKNSLDLPSRTFLTKSFKVMDRFNEILQNNQPAKYDNKWDIANLLKQAIRNGENSIILEKHSENIQILKTRNRFH